MAVAAWTVLLSIPDSDIFQAPRALFRGRIHIVQNHVNNAIVDIVSVHVAPIKALNIFSSISKYLLRRSKLFS